MIFTLTPVSELVPAAIVWLDCRTFVVTDVAYSTHSDTWFVFTTSGERFVFRATDDIPVSS